MQPQGAWVRVAYWIAGFQGHFRFTDHTSILHVSHYFRSTYITSTSHPHHFTLQIFISSISNFTPTSLPYHTLHVIFHISHYILQKFHITHRITHKTPHTTGRPKLRLKVDQNKPILSYCTCKPPNFRPETSVAGVARKSASLAGVALTKAGVRNSIARLQIRGFAGVAT